VGGGYELALACDYRISSNDKCTKIGLPEVTLGILPAWGGCTRLPEVIGLPGALNVILTGKQYASKPAKKIGLVDVVVHKENLIDQALKLIRERKVKSNLKHWLHYALPGPLVMSKAKSTVMSKTHGNYPAPLKILEVVYQGSKLPQKDSLLLEKEAFLELCNTPHMKNLLRIFFLQEKAKKIKQYHLSMGGTVTPPIKNVVVVGGGTMGAGITQWVSSRGIDVLLKEVNDELVGDGLKRVGKLYVRGVQSYKMDRPAARDGLARVTGTAKDVNLHNKQILIEAIVENLSVKQKVLSSLEEQLPDDAIIATNTSALSVDEIASCLKRPERFVGIHFFNPVHKMKLVEIVRSKYTTDSTLYRAVEFVQQIGKLPVIVNDSPGFVVNRILVPYLMKAAELLEQGAQKEAIDAGMVKFGMPMGPFRLMDEIGLDICYHVANDLKDRLGMYYSLEELSWRVQSGMLGKKTKKGFYTYKNGRPIKKKVTEEVDVSCLVDTMSTEAQNVIDEKVIDDPNMLDFAMIMGTGWAPFRGGPLKYAEQSLLTHSS
jgi:3-hydroxyacyl-CoA dehydrogenase/enoyl-CoA hydratase/3-hydroxybutyryl-CoA epimerase